MRSIPLQIARAAWCALALSVALACTGCDDPIPLPNGYEYTRLKGYPRYIGFSDVGGVSIPPDAYACHVAGAPGVVWYKTDDRFVWGYYETASKPRNQFFIIDTARHAVYKCDAEKDMKRELQRIKNFA